MPNYVSNHFRIRPTLEDSKSKKQYKDFRKRMFHMDEYDGTPVEVFDFNGIIPMPKELQIPVGTHTSKEDKEQAKLNMEKYGYAHWYEWSINKWGTKWNACYSMLEYDGDFEMELTFQTAWSVPEPVIKALVEKYKLLTFIGSVTEEGDHFMGYIGGRNGVLIQEIAVNPF